MKSLSSKNSSIATIDQNDSPEKQFFDSPEKESFDSPERELFDSPEKEFLDSLEKDFLNQPSTSQLDSQPIVFDPWKGSMKILNISIFNSHARGVRYNIFAHAIFKKLCFFFKADFF